MENTAKSAAKSRAPARPAKQNANAPTKDSTKKDKLETLKTDLEKVENSGSVVTYDGQQAIH
ncbi:MAG: hypothetical protein FWF49_04155, partial [Oscillospiraceae bacterium]|nr:hypothetical protein [Oscillospiraceae bacterium]